MFDFSETQGMTCENQQKILLKIHGHINSAIQIFKLVKLVLISNVLYLFNEIKLRTI